MHNARPPTVPPPNVPNLMVQLELVLFVLRVREAHLARTTTIAKLGNAQKSVGRPVCVLKVLLEILAGRVNLGQRTVSKDIASVGTTLGIPGIARQVACGTDVMVQKIVRLISNVIPLISVASIRINE